MLCAQYNKEKNLVLGEIDTPKINPNEALLKVNVCGVCGSDLVKIKQGLIKEGTVLGHEVVGTIIETGHLVRNWNKGQKIVVAHHVPCLSCHFCKSGNFSMCKQFKETNIFPGGFSEYIKVSKAHLDQTSFLIPKSTVSDVELALTEPLACCIRAVDKIDITPSNTIIISGLGSIGQMLGMLCVEKGAHVIGIDLIEERLNLAKILNSCDQAHKPNSEGLESALRKKTDGRGVDLIFLSSGSDNALQESLKYIRPGGTIIIFSSIPNNTGITNNEIYYKELNIKGCYSPSPTSLSKAFQMIITGKIKLSKLVTDKVKLSELPQEITKCLKSQSLKMMVIN